MGGCWAKMAGCALALAFSAGAPTMAQTGVASSPLTEVVRLAEILGSTHYLQLTCAGDQQQVWRGRMVRLMELEAPQPGQRRDRLVRAFNDGFRAEERRHQGCGRIQQDQRRLAAEGRRAAESLQSLYID